MLSASTNVETDLAEEDNSTTLEGNESCNNEQCNIDDGDYEYVPDPNYKGEPYHSLPCKYLRGSSHTPSGWARKYIYTITRSKNKGKHSSLITKMLLSFI